ncbi:MAG: GumC family protein [bacterium]
MSNGTQPTDGLHGADGARGGFRLVDLAEILARDASRIIGFTLAVGVITAAISLVLPAWFSSRTTIFGPEDVSETRHLLTTLRSLSIPGVRQNVNAQSPETFIAILESRKLRERIIERFELVKAFRSKGVEDALRRLKKHVWVDLENTGIISVDVEDRDRERAAAIANAMIEELNAINVELRIYKSRRARQHLEAQLVQIRTRLGAAEESLAAFQTENLAVALDEQAKAAITAFAELEAQAMALRVRKALVEGYATESNPEYRALARELASLEAQLKGFEVSSASEIPFARLPALGLRLAHLMREAKVGEALLAILTEEYEQARLDEAKETPVVQVLDTAVPAERRSWPKRSILVVSAMAAAFVVALAASISADRYAKLADPDDARRWSQIARRFLPWLRRDTRHT